MANWERRYIRRQLTLPSDAGTHQERLPRSGFCSGLTARLAWTNGGTGGGGEDIIDAVDRIEVIGNGSDVLYSLEGIEVAKWAEFINRRQIPQNRDDRNGEVQFASFPIMFGRRVGDDELWLDLAQWNEVELRVQFSPTIAAAQFATGTGVLDIIAHMYREGQRPPNHRGWLRTTQIRAFTSLADGEEEIELSRRYPFTGILVYAFETGVADGVDITQAEIRANGGRYIPFTGRWLDIQDENARQFEIESWADFYAQRANNETIETRLGRIRSAILQVEQAPGAGADFTLANVASIAGGRITTNEFIVEGSATYAATLLQTTDQDVHVQARGFGVGNAILLPFAMEGDLAGALQAPSFDDVELILTQGGAGAAVRVSTQELVGA